MFFLYLGLIIFFTTHLLPTTANIRQSLQDRLGYFPYLSLYSALSLFGFILIIYGFGQSPHILLWSPLAIGKILTMALMPFAFVLLISAYVNGHIKNKLKHPMLIATMIWSSVHLTTNGDLASTLIFGSFFVYAIVAIAISKPHKSLIPKGTTNWIFDLVAIVLGIAICALVIYKHQYIAGVPIVS
jgi:uncharacterized membrane protein